MLESLKWCDELSQMLKQEWELALIQSIRHCGAREMQMSYPWRVISLCFPADVTLTELGHDGGGESPREGEPVGHQSHDLQLLQFHYYLHKGPSDPVCGESLLVDQAVPPQNSIIHSIVSWRRNYNISACLQQLHQSSIWLGDFVWWCSWSSC